LSLYDAEDRRSYLKLIQFIAWRVPDSESLGFPAKLPGNSSTDAAQKAAAHKAVRVILQNKLWVTLRGEQKVNTASKQQQQQQQQEQQQHYNGWRQLCVHAQTCMQGSGDAACLLCNLVAVSLVQWRHCGA
jgi:hypothetical protein